MRCAQRANALRGKGNALRAKAMGSRFLPSLASKLGAPKGLEAVPGAVSGALVGRPTQA